MSGFKKDTRFLCKYYIMRSKDTILLEQAYQKVLKEEMEYPTNWNKGFQEPLRIAAGGAEVPFLKDGKWYLRVYDGEKSRHYVYSYSDDMIYPEDQFSELPEHPDLNHDFKYNPNLGKGLR